MNNSIAFYGTGMLGTGFVRHLRAQDIPVRVWNRSFDKAKALESVGAQAFEDPAEAARGAGSIHICVRDGGAVDDVLTAALPGIAQGTPIIDHTTVEPDGLSERAQRLAASGHPFLYAPVFMGPPQAESGTGTMLASGSRELFDRLELELAKLANTRRYLGERIELAAVYKLMGNLMILATIGGLNDMYALAEANGITRADAYKLFEFYSPQGQIDGRGKRMAHAQYDALWTLDMALKDAMLMLDSSGKKPLPIVEAVASELRDGIARGNGGLDLAAIAKHSG